MKPYIEFKKQRELGEILSDTFAFIRNEFKPFYATFFKIVGPYLLVMLICYGAYVYMVGDFVNFNFNTGGGFSYVAIAGVSGLAFLAAFIATYALSAASTLFYIRSYANNKGSIDFDEIKNAAYGAFWDFVGLFILVGLCVGVGFMFCIIPGIYLYVPLSLSFSILVFNRKSVSEAFGDSFTLVKDHWWMTFATLLVVGIIVAVAGFVFSLPNTIYTYAKMGIFSGEIDAENFGMADPLTVLFGIISMLAQFLLNIISVIAGVFIYFDLNEKKNFTGTYERIKNLGGTA
ncbi:MAG: hypothetical protein WBG48_09075 [Pricia sp.]